jgi:vitamin B12 transporter
VTIETFASNGRNRRIEYQGTAGLPAGWDAVFGAEHEHSDFRTASPSAFTPNPTPAVAAATINSGYLQLHGDVVPDLSLTAGVRYDDHDTYGGRATGQFAGAWSLNDGATVLRASFGQGFKAPTLYQLFSIYGNRALKPESANSWDGGVEQRFLDGALVVSATGFYRKTTNQIDFVSCPSASPLCTQGSFGIYDNIARTHADGLELAGAAKAGALSLQANYTYTDAVNDAPGANYGKKLPRRPTNAANATLTYAWPQDVSTSVAVHYVGDTFDTVSNSFVLHSYTLVDLRASWQIMSALELYGRIENLFDKTYETTRNYGALGRGFFAGIRAHF